MFLEFFNEGNFYFSESNLTTTFQDRMNSDALFDKDFLANFHQLTGTLNLNKDTFDIFSRFIIGHIEYFQINQNEKVLKYLQISSKVNKRLGPRFFSRGADQNGYVSNHVKTELIVTVS